MAIRVPRVITLPAYRLVAAAEKPHWGTAPKMPPNKGPNFPAFSRHSAFYPLLYFQIFHDKIGQE